MQLTQIKSARHNRNRDAGQSIVVVALLLVALVAMLGLVIDGGVVLVSRRQAQNAADAAAMAGVRALAAGVPTPSYTAISSAVTTFVQTNADPFVTRYSAPAPQVQSYFVAKTDPALASRTNCDQLTGAGRGTLFGGSVPADAIGVRVYVSLTYQPLFIGVVNGGNAVTSGACATAIYGPLQNPTHIQPIAVPRCYADPADPYNARCKQNPTDDPTKVDHIILGVGSQKLFEATEIRAIVNFNDRVLGNPPPDWDMHTEVAAANLAMGVSPNDCGYNKGSKAGNGIATGKYYIESGGYDDQCGSLGLDQWINLFFGNSSGNAGPGEYRDTYAVGNEILVILYQECQTDPQKNIPQVPAFCGSVDGGGNVKLPCNSDCRVKLVGYAVMRLTEIDNNSMRAIFSRNPRPEEVCRTCGGGIDTIPVFQLVP